MSAPRKLKFANLDEALAETARLRRGYQRHGNWTLPQIAWHIAELIEKFTQPAEAGAVATPDQAALKARFVDYVVEHGELPSWANQAPPTMVPPSTAGEPDVDRLIARLNRLKNITAPVVQMGPLGPVPIDQCRAVHIAHVAHHLSFLEPATPARRNGLSFESEDDVIADVERLRRGYAQAGSWSLPQTCWHLSATTKLRMQPGPYPPDTPEQQARRPVLEQTLATGQLPSGMQAPAQLSPPPDAGDAAIDEFIATLRQLAKFPGPIAPHRIFGRINDADARRLNRIHCAHHLSHLVPST